MFVFWKNFVEVVNTVCIFLIWIKTSVFENGMYLFNEVQLKRNDTYTYISCTLCEHQESPITTVSMNMEKI